MINNIPEVKAGVIAVSRSCFPAALSERRRAALVSAYGEGLYEWPPSPLRTSSTRRKPSRT